jgi:hypothetical protein
MTYTVKVETSLTGENRTKLNQVINGGIDKLRSSWNARIDHVNVNGEVVIRSGDPVQIISYLESNPTIAKYAKFTR